MRILKENINKLINNVPPIDDMWCVSIVWVDAFYVDVYGEVKSTYCYFYDKYIAEKWLSDFVKDGRPYYAKCCDNIYMNRIEEFIQY